MEGRTHLLKLASMTLSRRRDKNVVPGHMWAV